MLKGELFSTDMVRAYLEGRKKHTARPVKRNGYNDAINDPINNFAQQFSDNLWEIGQRWENRISPQRSIGVTPKYQPGDFMYCRETFFCEECVPDCAGRTDENECPFNRVGDKCYGYKAQYAGKVPEEIKWRPSIHMPRSAARLFFRVTKVEVMRLEDVNEQFARDDGFISDAVPQLPGDSYAGFYALDRFSNFWRSTYGPDARWMWVYWTDPVSKEEALADGK